MSQWAREHPEEMAEIAAMPIGKQLDALRAAHGGGFAERDAERERDARAQATVERRAAFERRASERQRAEGVRQAARRFDVIDRRRWILVAEWMGTPPHGQRTARWFKDKDTGAWYLAESWQRHKPHGRLSSEAAATVEQLVGREALAAAKPEGPPPPNDRDDAIKRIRRALRKRSGKSWSVTGGRGTSWGWITIHALPAHRDEYGGMDDARRAELGELLGLDGPVHHQGVSIPAGSDYRTEYVDRAEGREPSTIGKPYWD